MRQQQQQGWWEGLVPSRAQLRRAAVACQAPACRDAVQCGAACRLVPCRAVPCRAVPVVPTIYDACHPLSYRHPGLELSDGGSAAATWGERMEEVRASVPMHHSANTHNTPPSRRPTMCTTRGGDLPHPTCIDIPASPWQPGASPPPRACRGGAVRARLGAWAVWLSDGSGWCWSAKQ